MSASMADQLLAGYDPEDSLVKLIGSVASGGTMDPSNLVKYLVFTGKALKKFEEGESRVCRIQELQGASDKIDKLEGIFTAMSDAVSVKIGAQ